MKESGNNALQIVFERVKNHILTELKKYDPEYHATSKITERDFNHVFFEIVTKKDSGIEADQWNDLLSQLSEIFLKNGGITVKELLEIKKPEELSELKTEATAERTETATSIFTEAERKIMMKDAKINELRIPRDARGLERDDENEHFISENEKGTSLRAESNDQELGLDIKPVSKKTPDAKFPFGFPK